MPSWLANLLSVFGRKPVPASLADLPWAGALVVEVNRRRRNLPMLSENADLTASATAQANRCAARGVLTRAGSLTRGECLAAGQQSAAEAVADWLIDPPQAREVYGLYDRAGGGVARDATGRLYWCLNLA